jgi:alpha-amylase/alpha-mannosidase (GH57 family)
MKKYICIHGHFYQPPRENAWLEEIEIQESAAPYHDWNERITKECYGPNSASRILDEEKSITDIVNNYERISFNFGPTLLSWLQNKAPRVYEAIIEADAKSYQRFNGHGNAMAQVYNHIIMPLANRRDKETQVLWGIADFQKRFNRKPEGMWLAETAADLETLEVLAANGIRFTVLAPSQAKRVRHFNEQHWHSVNAEQLDTTQPYMCRLPSGNTIALFFYNGAISQELAFNGLLDDGKKMAHRLLDATGQNQNAQQLIHVATDGETYGHHHRHGDMALAYCLNYIEKNTDAELINYGAFLEKYPPQCEVEIHQKSSWSCAHGVERWRSDCGCNTGGKSEWNQAWRAPLRFALDWLRDRLGRIYFKEIIKIHSDPWKLRNDYICVMNNRNEDAVLAFLSDHQIIIVDDEQRTRCLRLLEMQRQALLMYTSCAWFFSEVSGIETIQVLQYASRAIQLAESASHSRISDKFESLLAEIPSNIDTYGTALQIYQQKVLPNRLSLSMVGMHYAVHSLFADNIEDVETLNYKAQSEYFEKLEAGELKLAAGKYSIRSRITHSVKQFSFVVLHLGQHHIIGASSDKLNAYTLLRMFVQMKEAFEAGDLNGVIQLMQHYFGEDNFSFRNLFRDEQHKVLKQITERDLKETILLNHSLFERNYATITALDAAGITIPFTLRKNIELVIHAEIRRFFSEGSLKPSRLKRYVEDALHWNIQIDDIYLPGEVETRIYKEIEAFAQKEIPEALHRIDRAIKYTQQLKLNIDFIESQTILFKLAKSNYDRWRSEAHLSEKHTQLFQTANKILKRLNIKITD